MPSGSDVAVVGGGVLGLALARRLARAGHTVTVYEGASQAGGLASPAPIGQYEWDRFYHVILQSDSRLLQLLAELGLCDRLHWGTTRTGFFVDGRLLSLSSSWDYLRFPALSLWDKARLARTILRASRVEDPRPLETIGAEAWLRRWSGDRVVDRLWLPLLRSKLGENYRRASAAFIWATIARLYAARRSGQKREQFGYVDGGYRTILAALVRRVAEDGASTAVTWFAMEFVPEARTVLAHAREASLGVTERLALFLHVCDA